MFTSCIPAGFSSNQDDNPPLRVLTSVYPVFDFASKIGGDHAEVILLVPSGFEPHSWEPSTRDMLLFEDADIFVYNGAGMEMWVDKILETIQNDDLIIVDTSVHVPLIEPGDYSMTTPPADWVENAHHSPIENTSCCDHDHHHDCDHDHHHDCDHDHHHDCDHDCEHDHHHDHHHECDHDCDCDHDHHHDHHHDCDHDHHHDCGHDHGMYDPHIWLDPQNVKLQMDIICQAFIQADPENADYYTENLNNYSDQLDALDQEFQNRLSPYSGQFIVVSHEAFGYLCKAYGLYQIPIRGVSADAEPDAARVREIIDYIRYYNINVIFFESLTDPRIAEAIASETGKEVLALHPIGGLTAEEADAGEDYFSLMERNLDAIEYALNLN